ncbi:MAG: endonuclease domain-containing protein [Actinomycetota bacterium]|nr:endonuclease domain-containing protein [Actinomycetota bacterium]
MVLRSQALALGMTDSMLHRRLSGGALTQARPGVYLLPGHAYSSTAHLHAVTSSLTAAVSHEAAAEIHGLPFVARGMLVVTVPTRTTHSYPDVLVHQSTDLLVDHTERIAGLRVTTVPRTIFDLASRLRRSRLQMLIEQAIIDRRCSWNDLVDIGEQLGRRGRPGSTSFRLVMEHIGPGLAKAESALEVRALTVLSEAGLPIPQQQYPLPWRDARDGRVDLAYPQARVIIELDGRRWHGRTSSLDRDHKRDRNAQLAGWRVFRFTWQQLLVSPHELIDTVSEVLAQPAAS